MLALALLVPMAAQAQTNYVYLSNQSASGNTISGFSVDHAGLLTSLGTPVATGGTGATVLCSGVDRMVVNGTTNLLFVANTGDQTISVLRIAPATGVLTAVAGSPFATGLTLDSCAGISLASTPDGKFLMAGANGQINTFSVAPATGALSLVSTVAGLPTPSVSLKISGNGQFLAASNQSSVSVFTINLDGSLTAVPSSPFAKQSTGLLSGLEFNCSGTTLYGSEGGAANSIADAWSVASTGALTPLVASPFTGTGSDSNVVYLTPDNTVFFQSNQGSNNLNSFSVNADGSLTSIGGFSGTTSAPAGLASDNSGLFLYAADDAFGLAVFNIFPNAIPTITATQAITPAGQIQGIAAYPPKSCAQSDFSITQTASPNPVTAGSQITYTITVTNNGPSTASVAINDLLPRLDMTFGGCIAGPGGVCDKGSGLNRTITFASLASGQSGTVTLLGATVSTLLNNDTISNTALVSNASTVDPNPANNSAITSVTVSAAPAASKLTVANATGSYFGTVNLSAKLTRVFNGSLVTGRTVTFSLNGITMGTATTDATGTATLSNVSLAGITAGSYLTGVGASFAGDDQFAATTGNAVLTVNKDPLNVTAQNASRLFGDPNPAFTYVITGFVNNETVASATSGTASCLSSANVNTNVGTAPINCGIGTLLATNYSFVFVPATLTINPSPLVLQGTDVSRLYGDPNPALTGTVVGLKSADKATASFSTSALTTSPVGVYPILGTVIPGGGFLASNYVITSAGNVTITPALLTATANNATRVYGDPNPTFTGTVTGARNSDVITATFTSTADPSSPVGTYPITATLTGPIATNYTVTTNGGILTITQAPLSVVAASTSRLYGDPNPAFTGTITGIKNADPVTATYASAATAASSVGTAAIVPTLVDPAGKLSNYTVTSNNGVLTINPAPLVVAAATASRLYGDPNPTFTGTITGIKNSDLITATFASVADATSSVGTFAIVPTLADPTGKLPNYTVTSTNGILTINPAPLTVAAANASRLYGDPNPAFTGTLTGIKNADNVTATFSSIATAASAVGSYPITATLVDPTSKLGNYAVTSTPGTLTVGPATLTVASANASRPYGDPNPAFTGTITGLKNNDNITATFASVATAASAVGSYPITATLTDPTSKLGNYTVVSNNGSLTVNPAALTVTATDATRAYGDPNPAFTGTVTGLKNSDNISATFASTAAAGSAVGAYPITPTLVDPAGKLANYTVSSVNGTLTVTAAALTVTAGNATRAYGDPNPLFTGTITGLRNSDSITATFATTATLVSPVGSYPITPALADPAGRLGNYTVNSANGILTVTQAALTVTAANVSRLYGDANPAFTGTIVGLKNGDAITASFVSAATSASPVGTFAIVPTLSDPTAKLSNYSATLVNGVLTVNPAPLTVSAASLSRVYGDANPSLSGTISGLKNGDVVTATFSSTATALSPVGTYAITSVLSDPGLKLANYSVVSNNGTLTITAAALSVSVANATRAYGDPNPLFTGVITGVKNGDNITSTFSSADAASPVGAYPIVPALVDPDGKLGNYSVTSTNGTLTITAATLSVSAANATRAYGDPNPLFTGTLTGLKNGDNITATFSSVDATSSVGTYAIVPALADPTGKLGNYSVTITNGTLTVRAAPLTVSAANASRVYGDPNPVFTGTITGLKNGDNITASFSSVDATSPVGTFAIIPALVDPAGKLANYSVTSVNGTLTITPAPLSASARSEIRRYGNPNPAFTGSLLGLKNGDNIALSFSTPADATSPVGAYAIVPALLDPTGKLGNYSVALTNGTLTIAPNFLTVTGGGPGGIAARHYGAANPAPLVVGLKNNDNITAGYDATAPTAASPVGSYTLVPVLNDPTGKLGNYIVTVKNGTLTIVPSPLTVIALSRQAVAVRRYGKANPSPVIIGLLNNDNITAGYGPTAPDATTPVGTYTVSPVLNDPTGKLGNYTVTTKPGTLTIVPALLTVTGGGPGGIAARHYGAANPAPLVVGLLNNDNISATYDATAPTEASPVGTYTLVPVLHDPTGKLGNYSVTIKNGTLTIVPSPLTVIALSRQAVAVRRYGNVNPAAVFIGLLNNDNITASYGPTAPDATTPVGTYTVTPVLNDPTGKLVNYNVTIRPGTLTIVPALLTVTGGGPGGIAVRRYGSQNPAPLVVGLLNNDAITAGYDAAAPTSASPVGTYTLVPVLNDPTGKLSNYSVTTKNGTLTVVGALLSITADNKSKLVGDPVPPLTATYRGFVLGENPAVLAGTLVCTTTATATSPAGTYPITCSGQTATNYQITFVPGTLTVK